MTDTLQLPHHYKKAYACFIKFACLMIFFALIAGILFQESTRKVTFELVGPGVHWESVYHLALLHGHAFLIGVLIPIGLLAMMHFGLTIGGKVISERTVTWGKWLYMAGALASLLLMLYKGYHYVLSVRANQFDFVHIQHQFFAGQELLKQVVYGLSHVSMSVGLGMYAVGIWRSLPCAKNTSQAV